MFRWIKLSVCAIALLTTSAACVATRTLIVNPGDPVQIRKETKHVPVWTYDESGRRIESWATIPAGWWALPDVYVPEEEARLDALARDCADGWLGPEKENTGDKK